MRWSPYLTDESFVESSLYYDTEAHLGDVHPFYYDGKMYLYYLSTDGTFTSLLLTSDNMVSYKETEMIQESPKPVGEYYVLGVIKEGEKFYSYYGYSQSVINGSVSDDLLTWQDAKSYNSRTMKYEHLPTVEYKEGTSYVEVRDPYVFYDPDIEKYRIIFLAYYKKSASYYDCELALTTSKGNSTKYWETENTVNHLRFDGAGKTHIEEPEVAQMMKIGDRWYTFAYMHNRTGTACRGMSYWFGEQGATIDETNWNALPEHNLNGADLVASQIVKVGDKYYLYGWITAGSWGGALSLAQEVYQKADGTLGVRLDPYLTRALNRGRLAGLSDTMTAPSEAGALTMENGVRTLTGIVSLGTFTDKTYLCGNVATQDSFGLTFSANKALRVIFDKKKGEIRAKLDGRTIGQAAASFSEQTCFQIINDGHYLDIFADGNCSLTVNAGLRGMDTSAAEISLFSQGKATVSAFDICLLGSPETFGN